jgi:hypothetical protein
MKQNNKTDKRTKPTIIQPSRQPNTVLGKPAKQNHDSTHQPTNHRKRNLQIKAAPPTNQTTSYNQPSVPLTNQPNYDPTKQILLTKLRISNTNKPT